MDKLLKQLLKDNGEVYSKIVTFIEHENTNRTDYKITVPNTNTQVTVVDGLPMDGGAVIKGIRLNVSEQHLKIPQVDTVGIIIFTNKYDAYVVQLSDIAYVRQTVSNNGKTNVVEMKVENDQSVYEIESDQFKVETNKGGYFSIIDKDIIISDVARIRFQVTKNGKVMNEIILSDNDGISVTSYNNTPIEIRNNFGSIKDIMDNIVDKFVDAVYIGTVTSPPITVMLDPISRTDILSLKLDIAKLLK